MIWPVILCGGSGSRLWPASRADRPKQFLPLVGQRSTFQNSLERVCHIEDLAQIVVVTGPALAGMAAEQAAEISIDVTVLVEPEARDSAPAIAAASAYVRAHDPDGVVLMLAADHHIEQVEVFLEAARQAAAAARDGLIATFGLTPSHAASGFGYIRPGTALGGAVRRIDAFVEKPDQETARRYLEEGYLWNSGNFAFLASILFEELQKFEPAIAEGATLACERAVERDGLVYLDAEGFSKATRISLDFAVMERTDRAAVVVADFDWSDLGAWSAIWEASPRDADGNSITGDVSLIDVKNVLVRSNGPFIGAIGVSDLVIVAEPDAVLVCRTDADQSVKVMVEGLKAAGRSMASRHAASFSGSTSVRMLASAGAAQTDLVTLASGGRYRVGSGVVVVMNGAVRLGDQRIQQGGSSTVTAGEAVAESGPATLLVTRWRQPG